MIWKKADAYGEKKEGGVYERERGGCGVYE